MNESQKYGPIIQQKFSEFSFPDSDALWPDMKSILDKEMPQNKKRRFGFWFMMPLGILVTCLCIYIYEVHYGHAAGSKEKSDTTTTIVSNKQSGGQNSLVLSSPDNTRQTPENKIQNTGARKKTIVKESPNENAGSPSVMDQPERITISKENKTGKASSQQTNSTKEESLNKGSDRIPIAKSTTLIQEVENPNSTQFVKPTIRPKDDKFSENNTQVKDKLIAEKEEARNKEVIRLSQKEITAFSNPAKDHLNTSPQNFNPTEGPAKDSLPFKPSKYSRKGKGWVIGASLNYHLPVSSQEMSTVNINGKKNNLIDFLPSLYVQYYFNKKWSVESSIQFASPQYISNHKLSSDITDLNANKKEENAIWLNKLYYWNVPLSVHFHPLTNLTIGAGIQYSYLNRSIFQEEKALWEKGTNGWVKTSSVMNVDVCSEAEVKKVKTESGNNGSGNGNGNNGNGNNGNGGGNNGNGNGGNGNNGNGGGNNGNGGNNGGSGNNGGNGNSGSNGNTSAATFTKADSVAAQTLRSSDWRMLFDINYQWKRFNIGCNFNLGLNNYINTRSGSNLLPVKDRNESLQLYLRYDLFDKRKKN